jgi:hypothetical protein
MGGHPLGWPPICRLADVYTDRQLSGNVIPEKGSTVVNPQTAVTQGRSINLSAAGTALWLLWTIRSTSTLRG